MSDLPSIDLVTFQLWDTDLEDWVDWTGSLQSVHITRGGATLVDVGTLSGLLIRGDDPVADVSIHPGQPVRVVRAGTTTPIFTGIVQDVGTTVVPTGGGLTANAVSLTAVDAVDSHQKNTRYGAYEFGHETFVERVTRLAMSSETPVALPEEPDPPLPWELQDLAYVSSLANHFDIACQTVGANWYVDSSNTTRFRLPGDDDAPVYTFSDDPAESLQYLADGLVIDSGSRQVVNVLKVINHGRGDDGNTYDIEYTFTDLDSVDAWGARAATVDMSLHDADTMLSGRAEAIFDQYGAPVREVQQFRFDAQTDPTVATNLDIQTPIAVEYDGDTFPTRIVQLEHSITPSSWLMTVTTSVRGVPEANLASDLFAAVAADGEPPEQIDFRAPQAPTNVSATPFAAWQGGEVLLAAQIEWDAVTLGDNGAPIQIGLYEVWGRPDDSVTPPMLLASVGPGDLEAIATRPDFETGATWLVKVRAQSADGIWGPFSVEDSVTFGAPGEELDAPTEPIVSTLPGLVLAQWDGNLESTPVDAAPAFLMDVLAQISTDVLDDDSWQTVRTLYVAGDIAVIANPVGWNGWVRFVARDRLGRLSDPSTPVPVEVPPAESGYLDIPSLVTTLVQAGIGGVLDLTANEYIELLAGRIDETQSVFRVTPTGAEIRQTGVASYVELTAEAVNLYGPAGTIGAQVTSEGLVAPSVNASQRLRIGPREWRTSTDGHHLTLRRV